MKGIFVPLVFLLVISFPCNVLAQNKVVLGCSVPMSREKSFLGKEIVDGLLSYFNYVNEKRLLKKKIELKVLDDRSDPELTLRNTKEFINTINPVALTSYVGTSNVVKVLNLITKEKMVLIGPLTGTHQLRLPFRAYVFNIRNSFWAEAEALVDFAFKTLKKNKIAILYQSDEYGTTGYKGVCRALAMKYNTTLVSEATYEKGKKIPNLTIRKILHVRPEVIILIGDSKPLSYFVKKARKRKSKAIFMTLSSVEPLKFAELLGNRGNGVFISQVVPPPDSNIKIAKEYRSFMKKYFPKSRLSFLGLESFLNAKVIVEGLKRCKNKISTKDLIKALQSFKKYDPGLGANIDYGPFDREGLDIVFITEIRNGKFILRKTIHKRVSLYFF